MPLILCGCALHRFRHRPTKWTLMIRVIFKFISALKQWLVCTIFFATSLLHLRTHLSTNSSLIFLRVFILIFSIISPTNTPRMMNQSIQLTLHILNFILTIQLTFFKYFDIFLIFHATPKILPQRRPLGIQKGRRPRTTDDPTESPQALHYNKTAGVGEQLQLFSTLRQSPNREQPNPLPAVERHQQLKAL